MSHVLNELVECIKCKQIWYKGEPSLNDKAIALFKGCDVWDVMKEEMIRLNLDQMDILWQLRTNNNRRDAWKRLRFIRGRLNEIETWYGRMGLNSHGKDQKYICPNCE